MTNRQVLRKLAADIRSEANPHMPGLCVLAVALETLDERSAEMLVRLLEEWAGVK